MRGFHSHMCHGVPVKGADGAVVGALCLSVLDPALGLRLRKLLVTSARGIETELRASALRSTLSGLRADPSSEAHTIALLHQDVVQSHAAARLQVELGARRMGLGLSDELVLAAAASFASFARSSSAWQLASGAGEPLDARELVLDVAELLQVEARALRVHLSAQVPQRSHGWPLVSAGLARFVVLETYRVVHAPAAARGNVVLKLVAAAEAPAPAPDHQLGSHVRARPVPPPLGPQTQATSGGAALAWAICSEDGAFNAERSLPLALAESA
jgi:hypothetical protein